MHDQRTIQRTEASNRARRALRTMSGVIVAALIAAIVTVARPAPAGAATSDFVVAVKLSALSTRVDKAITVSIANSTVPKGVAKIQLTWGDGSSGVALAGLTSTASHAYTKPGRYTVAVTITDRENTSVRATQAATILPPTGRFSGAEDGIAYVHPVTFYVSNDGKSLQDVTINGAAVDCLPSGRISDHLDFPSIALNADGSFTATRVQQGVYLGNAATFTYEFNGRFTGRNASGVQTASGTFRERVTYSNGVAYSCSTGVRPWSAKRDTQPTQPTARPPAGSYAGSQLNTSYLYPVAFYVSNDRLQLQDITVGAPRLSCMPGNAQLAENVEIPAVTLNADGSFSSTTTQLGVYAGFPVAYTSVFTGHFHGVDAYGVPRAAGQFRVTATYNDGVARTCTTNDQAWYADRDAQPEQSPALPPRGRYAGSQVNVSYLYPVAFYVSNDSRQLQDITVGGPPLSCAPGNTQFGENMEIPSVPLNADGSFAATTTQTGIVSGRLATYTLTFNGRFHGVDSYGVPRAAGRFRVTASYNDGVARTCTTNDQAWYADRDAQPEPPTVLPPAGNFAGSVQNVSYLYPVKFSYSSGALHNVTATLPLRCTSRDTNGTLTIPSIAVQSDGSFAATTSGSGTFLGKPATITQRFDGHFHGLDAQGTPRAAGTLKVTVTYTDGVTHTCTSNDQAWYAKATA